jgi:hypothetical protein
MAPTFSRLHRTAAVALGLFVLWLCASTAHCADSAFAHRGYYFTFCRMPEYDLAEWKDIVDCVAEDRGNTMILWVGGAFRSKAYPITWEYNRDHNNVERDFLRELIDYAHTKDIRILLGFTPYGYDGVNQYYKVVPDAVALGPDGKTTKRFGIHSWGYSLCAAREDSQRFMLGYVRELLFDFYPNADGMLIESSDYSACHCPKCGGKFFDHEFTFVKQISEELWAKKPEATIIVYPRYFAGGEVPELGVRGTTQEFDPRWTLFFTPHSAHVDRELIKKAKSSLWSDDSTALKRPADVQRNAKLARDAGINGYMPSLETFSYIATEAEEGQAWLKGRRHVPLGMGWLRPEQHPYRELPIAVQRAAMAAYSHDPDMSDAAFRAMLGKRVLEEGAKEQAINDLLALEAIFASERTWYQPSPVVSIERITSLEQAGALSNERRARYREQLDQLTAIASRYSDAKSDGERKLFRTADWIVRQWDGNARKLLHGDESRSKCQAGAE